MSTIANKKGDTTTIYNPNIPDYNKTPFAMKKAERARAFLAKHGLPKKGVAKKK